MPASVRHIVPYAIISVVGLIIYSNSLTVPFILDDVTSILVNPQIKSFVFSFKTRIIGELSFALNYSLHGFNLPGYHLFNIFVHLTNSSLVYFLVITIFRTPLLDPIDTKSISLYIAMTAALLFVTHPLQTAAVTYIAQRVTILAALFYLLAILFYLHSRLTESKKYTALWLLLSLFFSATAVFSKESAVTVPVAILLCELTFFRGALFRRMFWLIYAVPPIILILLYNPKLIFQPDIPGALLSMTAETGAPSRTEYLFSQFPVLVDYLRLFVFPVGQNLDHDIPIRSSFFDPSVLSSLVLLTIIAVTAIFALVRGRQSESSKVRLIMLAGFGFLWFYLTISIESGLVPIRDLMFEHRMYIPLTGLSISVSVIMYLLLSGMCLKAGSIRIFIITITGSAVLLGILTYSRNRAWKSEISIWEDAVRKSPNKGRTHGALGHAYQRSKMWQDAKREYLEAIKLSPSDQIAVNNLGVIYLIEKRYPEAIVQFKKAVELLPTTAATHYNIGLAYSSIGDYQEARKSLLEAVRLNPNLRAAKVALGRVEKAMGQ